ncbi:MAG: cellulase family glycosylhydrolase [Oscillospiraceae bacterium]|nr:cellulase family glycosylhydrolase [Oscillospiraceae bacterium]
MVPFAFTGNQIPKGILDFSYLLDAPAGKHGFLHSKDGHFYFEDGTQIKFFGVNLVFGCAMPLRETADMIAERLARNGINMVRFHHVDSQSANSSLIDYSGGKSQTINETNIARLDYLVYKLKEKGIYIHIDTHTLHKFTKDDGLDFKDDVPPGVKTITYYNKKIIELHRDYMKKYLCHKNPYTGMRYIDDPCVAVVQMVNENSVFWFNEMKMPPSYEKELNGLWNKWLSKKYGGRQGLDEAWTSIDGKKALFPEENPAENTVKGPLMGIWGEKAVEYDAPYDAYESPARNADSLLFYTEIEKDYYADTSKYLRGIGVKCVIDLSNLPANITELYCIAQGEVVENNGYWNHPEGGFSVPVKFHDGEMVKLDPRKEHHLAFSGNLTAKFASTKVTEKPLIITEWNVCYPTAFRSDVMLTLAAYGAYQDWDGLLLFSYSHQSENDYPTRDRIAGFFDSYNDPAVWGMAGICSAVFQGKMITPPKTKVEVAYTDEDRTAPSWLNSVYYTSLAFMTGVSVKFIKDKYTGNADMAISGLNTSTGDYTNAKKALVFSISPYKNNFQKENTKDAFYNLHLNSDKIRLIDDTESLKKDPEAFTHIVDACLKEWGLIDKNYGYADGCFVNDTSELKYDFKNGIFAINSDKVKAICGYVKGIKSFGDIKTEIENEKAAVTAISCDGNNMADSKKILLSVIGNCSNSDMVWEEKTLVNAGKGPTIIEKIKGNVYIVSNHKSCNAFALDADGNRMENLETEKTENGFSVNITSKTDTIYYELEVE